MLGPTINGGNLRPGRVVGTSPLTPPRNRLDGYKTGPETTHNNFNSGNSSSLTPRTSIDFNKHCPMAQQRNSIASIKVAPTTARNFTNQNKSGFHNQRRVFDSNSAFSRKQRKSVNLEIAEPIHPRATDDGPTKTGHFNRRDSPYSEFVAQLIGSQQDLSKDVANLFCSKNAMLPKYQFPVLPHRHVISSNACANVVPMFPTLTQQTVKWNPYVENTFYPIDDNQPQPDTDERNHNCWCKLCSNKKCVGQLKPNRQHTEEPNHFIFSNNIIKFCDRETMTSQMNDAAVGICFGVDRPSHMKSTEVWTANSVSLMRSPGSTPRSPCAGPRRTVDCPPISCERPWAFSSPAERDVSPRVEPPERLLSGADDNYHSRHEWNMSPPSRDEDDRWDEPNSNNRRMLYNEGISDSVVQNLPKKKPVRNPTKEDYAYCWSPPKPYTEIPHSHRRHSKFHTECREPALDETRRGSLKRHIRPCGAPCHECRYAPRRVIPSEKDFNTYIVYNMFHPENEREI